MGSDDETVIDGKLLKDMKLAELKKACKNRDLPCNGTKATVMKRLKAVSKISSVVSKSFYSTIEIKLMKLLYA